MYFIIISIISIFFFPLGCHIKKKKKVECHHYKIDIQSSLPMCLLKQKVLPTSDAVNSSSPLWQWLVISFCRPSSSHCPWPGSLWPWSGQWPVILIHPICRFFGHLQARLLLSQKTLIWQREVKNSLGKLMRMINYEKSAEDRDSTLASQLP